MKPEDAALEFLGGRAAELETARTAAIETAARLNYIKLPGNAGPIDIDLVKLPHDIAAAEKFAAARISRVLQDPSSTQAERSQAMRIWQKAKAQIEACRSGETEFAAAAKSISTKLEADKVRAAAQAKKDAERDAAEQREKDRKFLSRDEFALKHGVL